MAKFIIYKDNIEVAIFSSIDFANSGTINIGGAKECEICLENVNASIMFSIVTVKNNFLAVAANDEKFIVNDTMSNEFLLSDGVILNLASSDFNMLYIEEDITPSEYSMILLKKKGNPQLYPLNQGVNLIGCSENCHIKIDDNDFSLFSYKTYIDHESIRLEVLDKTKNIIIAGRNINTMSQINEDTIFSLNNKFSGKIIHNSEIKSCMNSATPLEKGKRFWQIATFFAMLLFLITILLYSKYTSTEESGKLIKLNHCLSAINEETTLEEAKEILLSKMQQNAENQQLMSMMMEINYLLNQPLNEEVKIYLTENIEALQKINNIRTLLNFYRIYDNTYNYQRTIQELDTVFDSNELFCNMIIDERPFWLNARDVVVENIKFLDDSNHSDKVLKNELEILRDGLNKKLDFYDSIVLFYQAYQARDFEKCKTYIEDDEFNQSLSYLKEYQQISKDITIGLELSNIITSIKDSSLKQEQIDLLIGKITLLQEDINGVTTNDSSINFDDENRLLNELEVALVKFTNVSKVYSNITNDSSNNELFSVLSFAKALSASEFFENNSYINNIYQTLYTRLITECNNESISLLERSKLIANIKLLPLLSKDKSTEIKELEYKILNESNRICNELYNQWRVETSVDKQLKLVDEILNNSVISSSYYNWALKQLD